MTTSTVYCNALASVMSNTSAHLLVAAAISDTALGVRNWPEVLLWPFYWASDARINHVAPLAAVMTAAVKAGPSNVT